MDVTCFSGILRQHFRRHHLFHSDLHADRTDHVHENIDAWHSIVVFSRGWIDEMPKIQCVRNACMLQRSGRFTYTSLSVSFSINSGKEFVFRELLFSIWQMHGSIVRRDGRNHIRICATLHIGHMLFSADDRNGTTFFGYVNEVSICCNYNQLMWFRYF